MNGTAEPVVVLTMGGTIDKVYTLRGELEIGPPAAAQILALIAAASPIEVTSVVTKDSLDLTDPDRELLAERIAVLEASRVVVTHGTDTMTETAEYLSGRAVGDKTVVLTGALVPAAMGATDAQFNLGFALAAARLCPPGVYVAMSGRVYPAGGVRKDRGSGVFVATAPGSPSRT